jgi:2-iminobutanoate/2-iminopropanoate deaminase
MIRYITDAPNAPKAIGPYSQATVANGTAYISGQIPLDPVSGKIVEGGIEAQTTQVLKNLEAILTHLGIGFNNVMKSTILLADLKHFQTVNELYERALGGAKPARATFQVAGLPRESLIEIEMIATLP